MVAVNLDHHLIRTPLLPLNCFDSQLDSRIYLKPENLQFLGSYKIHGVVSFFNKVPFEDLKNGVTAISAGNMGQAIAFFANQLGIPCSVYLPETAPSVKKNRIKALNAQIKECSFPDLWQYVMEPSRYTDEALLVHPVFTPELLIGYERIAYEIIQDLPDMDAIVIPIGLGGLAIALSRVIKKIKPDAAIFLCETEAAPTFKTALEHGQSINIEQKPSFIDAIGTPQILPHVYSQLAPLVHDSEVVSIASVKEALRLALFNNKILCEGAAACSIAAAIAIAKRSEQYKKIVCVLTGGNLAPEYLVDII